MRGADDPVGPSRIPLAPGNYDCCAFALCETHLPNAFFLFLFVP